MQLRYLACLIFDHFIAAHDIGAHEANLCSRAHAEEFRGRHLRKIAALNIDLAPEGQLPCAELRLCGVVGQGKGLGFIRRIVCDNDL